MSLLPVFRTLASLRRTWLALSVILSAAALSAAETPAKQVEQFLSRYCLECHAADVQKGDRSFEKFTLPLRTLPEVIEAPAISGACMLIARDLALELGGFDPDYLIGDFEDADLCRRIARKGLRCVVDTRARAHHLERQSQGNSADQWRRNVTLFNAWIFNTAMEEGVGPAWHAEAASA